MKCTGIGKKTLSFILAFCMVLGLLPGLSLTASAEPLENWIDSAAESFAAGDGSQSSPYQITTAGQLSYLAKKVNTGTTYSGTYFTQTANIDLTGKNWTPIGYLSGFAPSAHYYSGGGFQGIYDGGGYTISNLNINCSDNLSYTGAQTSTVLHPTGLFGIAEYCVIKNVHLFGVNVTNTSANSVRIGALVGETWGSQILNCSAVSAENGIVMNSSNAGVGGLIGETRGTSSNVTYLANCYTNLPVSSPMGSAGGITGCHGSDCIMANCYARGNVTGSSTSNGGGLASVNYGNISNCYATGKLNGSCRPVAPNTTNAGFTVIGNSVYYLSDSDGSSISGYTGIGATENTMKSDTFAKTLNINRSCVSGLMPTGITLYKWKIAANENDGYPVFDTSAIDASDGTASNSNAIFSGGNGSQSTPYQISCKEDMIQYEVNINSHTQIGTSGTYYSAAYYIVTKDIDMGGATFTPIGLNSTTAFSGSINFQNHIIVNYTPDTSTGVSTDYGDLIGVINNPKISNYTAAIIGTADSGTTLSDGTQTSSVKTTAGTYEESSGYSLIQDGEYLLRESYDWSGTVTPSKGGYTFTPASRTYSNIKSNQTGQTYTTTTTHPTLTATADNIRNCIDLSWTPMSANDHYMVYQKDSGETIYQSIPVSTNIKVLNVYPDVSGSDSLYTWMQTYGSPTVDGVSYTMAVTKVSLSNFNTQYATYLTKNEDGSYPYDVLYFGAWDANNNMDLSNNALTAVKAFIDYGGGCLLGHDTESFTHTNFIDLAKSYLNMDVNYVGDWNAGGKNSAYPPIGAEKILVHKKGLLTNYPYSLGDFDTVLTTPLSHSYYEFAKGDVWFTYQANTWSETKNLPGAEKSVSKDGAAGTNNFYLTTWNNCAAIQTGHSYVEATSDEQKILTNTLYYLAQVTKSNTAADHMAQDLAAPDPINSTTVAFDSMTLSWTAPSDNGSTYDYYVREFTSADGSSHVDSDTKSATVTTGVAPYYTLVDTYNTATVSDVESSGTKTTDPTIDVSSLTSGTKYYVHIITVDGAGNKSGVTTASFTTQSSPPVAGSGNALSFDGTDDYIDIPSNNAYATNKFTVEAWMKYDTNQDWSGVVDKGRNLAKNWWILTSDGSSRGVAVGMAGTDELAYKWNDSDWHHVCITYDGTTFSLYVDGVLRGSAAASLSDYQAKLANTAISFGRRQSMDSGGFRYFTGQLDEVKIWNTGRTKAEIQSDIYSHPSTSESGLAGYWSFDEGSGVTAKDTSSTNANGTLTNMATSSVWISSPAWQNRVTAEGTALTLDAGYAPDSGSVTLAQISPPSHGTISFNNTNKTVTYTPTNGYYGSDIFTYSVTNSAGTSSSYSVDMTVVQNPVITGPESKTAAAGTSAAFAVTVSAPSTALTYQWQKLSGSNWQNIGSAIDATYTIGSVTAGDAGQYRCVVTATVGTTTATTTSGEATLTVTFASTVNIRIDDSTAAAPGTGTVELKQSNDTKATLPGDSGVYIANVPDGTYNVFVNNEDTGKTIKIDGTEASATVNYYTVSFKASDSGAAFGSAVTVTAGGSSISSGAIVLSGKKIVLTATGTGVGTDAIASSYTYGWTGAGTSVEATAVLTIDSLGCAVNATCMVTGNATYAVTLNSNGSTINNGSIISYTYGTGATLPTDVTKDGYVFGGWYASSDFSGSAMTTIGNTDKGMKIFYAKWVQNPVMTGPESKTASAGTSAAFAVTVSAPSTGLTYQWQKYNGSTWENIGSAIDATYTIGSVTAGDAGQYRCIVTATVGTTTATTTSGEATLTVTFTATVNVKKDSSASSEPVTGAVELKQSGTLKAMLTGSGGVYLANVPDGTYNVFVNNEDTRKTIKIDGAEASATVNYYTVSFQASDSGAAFGSAVTATASDASISSGATVLSGKKIVLTATGTGVGTDATASSYTYSWTGNGTSDEATAALTIDSLGCAVNATCTVTGSATYALTLNANGGTINSGNIISYTYGTGATLPTDITKDGYVFGGWYASSDFSDSAVTAIGNTDKGTKIFYAKWVQNPVMTCPESKTTAAGTSAAFAVTVSAPSTGLTYQWQKYNGSTWSNITSATDATYTIGSVTAADAGRYRCVVTATVGTTTATTASGEATLTVTFASTVNIRIDASAAAAPGTGTVELKQSNDTKATLTGSGGVYLTNVPDGTYSVFVNNEDTGKTIKIDGAEANATVNYYTVSFQASDNGATFGSAVTATAGDASISSGAIVLSGKKIVLTATGTSVGTDAIASSYTYGWTGAGTSVEATAVLTIDSLGCAVNATCMVTGNATYAVTLNSNGSTINSGSIISYTYGTGATLPTDVTKDGYVFGGWYASSDFSGSAVTTIGNTDKGMKIFYAKWVQNPAMTGPESKTAAAGTSAAFAVTVSAPSAGLTYQWQKYNGSTWNNITSSTDATYTIGSVTAADAGRYRCVVTATVGTTTATTTSGEATLTVTFASTVNIRIDASAASAPGTGTVELKQSNDTKATLTGSGGVYTSSVVNGTYDVYVNGEDTEKTIAISDSENNVTVDYYTVSFHASNSGTASGSSVSAAANNVNIDSGTTVLAGKKVVLTATGAGTSYYSYFWSGSSANGETSVSLTIHSLSGKVDTLCTVTGRTSPTVYSVSLDTNGGTINSGSITSYTYGVSATLPVNVTRADSIFIGWFMNETFSGSPVTETSATDTGDKTFYAKWNYDISGVISGDDGTALYGATVTIRGNNITPKSTTTNLGGNYSFSDIAPGEYNIVALYNGVTKTIILRVTAQNITDANITMPAAGAENSFVTIAQDTPDVVVGYLDEQFSDDDDQYVAITNNTVKLELAVEEKSKEEASGAAAIQAQAGSRTIGMYLDMTLTKTRTGDINSNEQLSSVVSLLKIIIPYDLSGKTNVIVYRIHEGTTGALKEQTYSESAPSDECYMMNTAENQVVVWAKKFSTYAIAYSNIVWDSGSLNYAITASAGKGGTISPSVSVRVTTGSSKTFTVTSKDGYAVSDVLVDGKSVGAVGSYTFANVTASHTISAVFTKAEGLPYYLDGSGSKVFIGFAEDTNGEMKYIAPEEKMVLFTPNPKSFTDISGHWGKSHIDFISEREIFIGTGNNIFSPDTGMTRAMFATVIGRLYERSYGTPSISRVHTFTDCDYQSWYGSYIDWCSGNGIIKGVGGGLFAPDRAITRQEMATILYRFAEFLKVSKVSESAALNYPDSANIAAWATKAALYCQETGIIEGRTGGSFVPTGTATRAEVAAILKRFIEKVV